MRGHEKSLRREAHPRSHEPSHNGGGIRTPDGLRWRLQTVPGLVVFGYCRFAEVPVAWNQTGAHTLRAPARGTAMKLLNEYLEHALAFERAARYGLPPPSPPQQAKQM